MKKLLFIFAVSAGAVLLAMPTGVKAQKHTYTDLYYISVKGENAPFISSTAPVKQRKQVNPRKLDPNAAVLVPNNNNQMWNGHLNNWPKKKPYIRMM